MNRPRPARASARTPARGPSRVPAILARTPDRALGRATARPPARAPTRRTPARTPTRAPLRIPAILALLAILLVLPSCATLQSLTALSQVRFDLDGVSGIRLAGVDLDEVRGYEDLSVLDAARIGSALVNRQLPLEATLHVGAQNPDGNPDARLVGLDWTFFLQDRETVSGSLGQELTLRSGARTDVPVAVRLDLLEFFEGSSRDLVELALSLAGVGTAREPSDLRLEALPTIQTRLGPIQYPQPLILGGQVGGNSTGEIGMTRTGQVTGSRMGQGEEGSEWGGPAAP